MNFRVWLEPYTTEIDGLPVTIPGKYSTTFFTIGLFYAQMNPLTPGWRKEPVVTPSGPGYQVIVEMSADLEKELNRHGGRRQVLEMIE